MKTIKVENEFRNESATSFRWLKKNLGLGVDAGSRCSSSWQQVRDSMRATTQIFSSIQDWISDFWICKTADTSAIGSSVVPKWDPPDELDDWPTVPNELLARYAPEKTRPTNHANFERLLNSATDVAESGSDAAVSQFYVLDDLAGKPAGGRGPDPGAIRASLALDSRR